MSLLTVCHAGVSVTSQFFSFILIPGGHLVSELLCGGATPGKMPCTHLQPNICRPASAGTYPSVFKGRSWKFQAVFQSCSFFFFFCQGFLYLPCTFLSLGVNQQGIESLSDPSVAHISSEPSHEIMTGPQSCKLFPPMVLLVLIISPALASTLALNQVWHLWQWI